jgi:hypothetical protein
MRRSLAAIAVAVAIAVFTFGASHSATSHGAPAAGEKFVFGVIPQQELFDSDFRAMHRGGIGSLRVALYWSRVEARFGPLNWSGFDNLVSRAARSGITVLPYLYGTPKWVANFDGIRCSGDCAKYVPQSSITRKRFERFASEAVRQYGPGGRFWAAHPELPYRPIRIWQIWNEQNSPKYFAPEPDAASYADLLARTSAAIRGVDPGAEILLGGMWGPDNATDVVPTSTYLRRLYAQPGARESFDSIGLHPYASDLRGMLAQIRSARRVARRAGDPGVALWITELGWASSGPRGHYLVKGRRGQAAILSDAYAALLERREEWRLRGAFWYAWKDTDSTYGFICVWCPGAGLRSVDGGGKPAWRSLKRVARRG